MNKFINFSIIMLLAFALPTSLAAQTTDAENFYLAGKRHFDKNEFENAFENFDKCISLCKETATMNDKHCLNSLYNAASISYLRQDYNKCIEYASELLKLSPEDVDALKFIALSLLEKGSNYLAADYNKKIISLVGENTATHLINGIINAKIKNYEQSYAAFERGLALEANDEELLIHYAKALLEQDRYDEAKTRLEKALQINPNNLLAINTMGFALTSENRCDKALEYYDKALQLSPNIPAFYCNRAYCHLHFRNLAKAKDDINYALDLNIQHYMAHLLKGRVFEYEKKYTLADEEYDKATSASPDSYLPYLHKGLLCLEQGKVEDARKYIQDAINKNPNDAESISALGLVFEKQGDAIAALEKHREAIAKKMHFAPAHARVAGILLKQGDDLAAKTQLDKAFSLNNNSPEILYQYGVYYRQRNFREAQGYLNKCLELDPYFTNAYLLRLDIYFDQNLAAEGLAEANNLEKFAQLPEAHLYKAKFYALQGNNEKASESVQRAFEHFPNNSIPTHYYFTRATISKALQQYDSAETDFRKVLQQNPDDLSTEFELAHIQILKGQHELAERNLNKILQKTSEDKLKLQAYRLLGDNAYEQGKFDHAISLYQEVINLSPDFFAAYVKIAAAYAANNNLELALQSYDKALQLTNNQEPLAADCYDGRGTVLVQLNRSMDALESYHKAVQLNPNKAIFRENRGLLLYNLGKMKDAAQDFTAAIELDNINPDYFFYRGKANLALAQYLNAEYDFNNAIKLNRTEQGDYYAFRGVSYFYQKKLDEAKSDWDKALSFENTNPTAHYYAAFVMEKEHQYDNAVAHLNKAIIANNKYEQAYELRGICYYKNSQIEPAYDDLQQATQLNPKNKNAYLYKGHCQKSLEKYANAVNDYAIAIDLASSIGEDGSSKNPLFGSISAADLQRKTKNFQVEALHNNAFCYYRLESYQAALDNFNQAENLAKTYNLDLNGVFYQNRGSTYKALGAAYKEQACLDFERALSKGVQINELDKAECNIGR